MTLSKSRSVTARNARELVGLVYDSVKILKHDVIISTNAPVISSVLVDGISRHAPLNGTLTHNDKFAIKDVMAWLTSMVDLKDAVNKFVVIIPKKFQVGVNLPSATTRIIVDDAGVFLGDVMVEIEKMKESA